MASAPSHTQQSSQTGLAVRKAQSVAGIGLCKQRPRVEQALRVQRLLDRLHHVNILAGRALNKFIPLEAANAVLGGKRAFQCLDDIVNDAIELALPGHEGRAVGSRWLGKIEMQIAISDMPEGTYTDARPGLMHGLAGAAYQLGNARHRHPLGGDLR